MIWRKLALLIIAALIVTAAVVSVAWRKHRPSSVPSTAVLVNGSYIDCQHSHWGFGPPCKVYDGSTGKLLNIDAFTVRLKALALKRGGRFVDCGRTSGNADDKSTAECAKAAFQSWMPFAAEYITHWGGNVISGYAVLGDADGNLTVATYDSRGFPDVRPTPRTDLLDGNRVRLAPCIAPITLSATEDGVIECMVPLNEKASACRTTEGNRYHGLRNPSKPDGI